MALAIPTRRLIEVTPVILAHGGERDCGASRRPRRKISAFATDPLRIPGAELFARAAPLLRPGLRSEARRDCLRADPGRARPDVSDDRVRRGPAAERL